MKPILIVSIIVAFFVQLNSSVRLEDVLPIKYDIVRVRNESQIGARQYAVLDFIGLVERHGYTAEEYKLTTWDGYILVLHRISGSPLNPKAPGKPVVFLQHGLFLSSDTFVLIGPGKDLAFLLADAGYDVWLGNARGNTYSRSHVFLSPKEKKFWEFSYHEIGIIDLSTSIDFVLSLTGNAQLIYIGYSMGTTEIFVLLSTYPEYNQKIKLLVCLAPIAFWRHKLPNTMQYVVNNLKTFKSLGERYEYYEVLPQSSFMGKFAKNFCNDKRQRVPLMTCTTFISRLAPVVDLSRLNTTAYPTILAHFPAGTSFQSVMHYFQNMVSGEFQAYDYGPEINYALYFRKTPPKYNLNRVTAPVALFFGIKDYFATLEDDIILLRHLPNVVMFYKVPHDNFNHLDFLWAKDVNTLLYQPVISLVKRFTY